MRRAVALMTWASLGLLNAAPATGADPLAADRAEAVRAYVAGIVDELGAPGAAVVIVSAEGIAYAEGFGMADDAGRAVTPQTPFRIASVSKHLTAIAVRQLIEEGQLELDASVHSYLPWFGADGSQTGQVTVRDLLGHTSGWTEHDGIVSLADETTDAGALERNVRRLAETAPSHPIGEYEYSNANYDVLGQLIAEASGTSYEAYMEERVFAPLAMTHTHASDAEARADGLAQGHYPFLGFPLAWEIPFVRGSMPSGFVMSSAEDLGHVLVAHLNDGAYGPDQVLPAAAMADLRNPLSEPGPAWGYGWGLNTYPLYDAGVIVSDDGPARYEAPVILEHGGSHATFSSGMLLLPSEGYGVVVLMNLNDESAPSRFYQAHFGIADILLGVEPPPLTNYDDLLSQYVRLILLGIVLLQIVGVGWALRNLRRWRADPPTGMGSAAWRVRHLLLPFALDIAVPVLVWWFVSDRYPITPADLVLVARLSPDAGLLLLLITVLGIGWGIVRTVLTLRALGRAPDHHVSEPLSAG